MQRAASINLCGWTSVLVPAFFMGFAVASATGSDPIGWLAALIVGAAIAGYQARANRAPCPLPQACDRTTDEPAASRR
jgi:hypothetical protein